MKLWIRSQDKMALAKFDLLILEKIPENNDKYMFIADHYKNMGVYATKERALEVLDEIQDRIIKLSALDMIGLPNEQIAKSFNKVFLEDGITNLKAVYEMPKE